MHDKNVRKCFEFWGNWEQDTFINKHFNSTRLLFLYENWNTTKFEIWSLNDFILNKLKDCIKFSDIDIVIIIVIKIYDVNKFLNLYYCQRLTNEKACKKSS